MIRHAALPQPVFNTPLAKPKTNLNQQVAAELDFVQLDTAEEATQLPLLDPAFQLALASTLKSLEEHADEPQAHVLTYRGQSGDIHFEQNLNVITEAEKQTATLSGFCKVGEENGFEVGTFVRDQAAWQGGYGANTYNFDLVSKGNGFQIDGSLGSVKVELELLLADDTFVTQGELNGRDYFQVTRKVSEDCYQTLGLLASATGDEQQAISRSFSVDAEKQETGGTEFSWRGRGLIAGQEHQSSVTLRS